MVQKLPDRTDTPVRKKTALFSSALAQMSRAQSVKLLRCIKTSLFHGPAHRLSAKFFALTI